MMEFKRTEKSAWQRWPNTSQPSPPPVDSIPSELRPCCYGDPGCRDWRGVHLFALRVDGRIWTERDGWRDSVPAQRTKT